MRQGAEADREQVALTDLAGRQLGQCFPAFDAFGQAHDRTNRDRLAACHGDVLGDRAGEVIALIHIFAAFGRHLGLVGAALLAKRLEVRDIINRAVRGLASAAVNREVLGRDFAGFQDRARLKRRAQRLVLRIGFIPVGIIGGVAVGQQLVMALR